ncbi:MAG: hypothetical protein DMD79_06425 [Candidatus Rokuibacteriota bacterium]|nr:MAG: hypothetical protein DMD79_06425 [Candidatus Rokubacteria bacterium]
MQRFQQDATRLDALVNNARVYSERRGPEGTRHPLETNFFGSLRLTEALLPVLNDGAKTWSGSWRRVERLEAPPGPRGTHWP